MKKRALAVALIAALATVMTAGCEGKKDSGGSEKTKESVETEVKNEGDPIVLATMGDAEGRIVGSMMRLMLEDQGYEVESSVGEYHNTTLARESLKQKQIDLSMDYTGRGLMFIDGVDETLYQTDLETAFKTTKDADLENGIVWLCYAPYNNTDGIAVSRKWSEENNVKSFQDFADFVNKGGEVKLAVGDGYVLTSPACIPGWEEAYGFHLLDNQIVVGVSDGENMCAQGIDGITATHLYTTSGLVEALDLVVLEDPEHVSPIYSLSPLATKDILEKYPELETMFNELFESIDEETIIELNAELEDAGRSEEDIALDYLEEKGFIK